MDESELQSILAYEYGYLDHKWGMAYNPPFGYETEYREGWESWLPIINTNDHMVVSYQDRINWGQY